MLLQDLMGRFVPLNELKPEALAGLEANTRIVRFSMDDLVFDFGDTSPYSYYLLQGGLALTSPDGVKLKVLADDPQAAYPVGNLVPRQMRARVTTEKARLLKVSRKELDQALAGHGLIGRDLGLPVQELEAVPGDQRDWTLALLNTPLFSLLPILDIRAVLEDFKGVPYSTGQVVIQEGDPAGYFYLLLSGTCAVTRRTPTGDIEINRIKAPDGFGDEALITGEPRGATITMVSDGVLMRVDNFLFHEHILRPLIRHTPKDSGLRLAAAGKALIVDVRDEDEQAQDPLHGAQHIPMFMLYLKSKSLNSKIHYLVYGSDDVRSQAAAFLLARRGLRATILGSKGRAVTSSIDQAMILPGAADV